MTKRSHFRSFWKSNSFGFIVQKKQNNYGKNQHDQRNDFVLEMSLGSHLCDANECDSHSDFCWRSVQLCAEICAKDSGVVMQI